MRAMAAPPPNLEVKSFSRRTFGVFENLKGSKQELHVSRDGEFGLMDFIRGFLKKDKR